MAESIPLEDIETGETGRHCRYFKMKVLKGHDSNDIDMVVSENIDEKSIVFSDRSKNYLDISKYIDVHVSEKSNRKTTTKTLPWVNIAISNAKRTLLGIYHKTKGKFLQLYLD